MNRRKRIKSERNLWASIHHWHYPPPFLVVTINDLGGRIERHLPTSSSSGHHLSPIPAFLSTPWILWSFVSKITMILTHFSYVTLTLVFDSHSIPWTSSLQCCFRSATSNMSEIDGWWNWRSAVIISSSVGSNDVRFGLEWALPRNHWSILVHKCSSPFPDFSFGLFYHFCSL